MDGYYKGVTSLLLKTKYEFDANEFAFFFFFDIRHFPYGVD